jgi:hypothetical protein
MRPYSPASTRSAAISRRTGQDVVGDGTVDHPEVGEVETAAAAGVPPGEQEGGEAAGLAGVALGDGDEAVVEAGVACLASKTGMGGPPAGDFGDGFHPIAGSL